MSVNVEDHERAMDKAFDYAHTVWKTDLYDSAHDARSEQRYTDDAGEPDTRNVSEGSMRV